MEKEVHDLKMSLDARQMELHNRVADVQSAANTLKEYEQQIRDLHVSQNLRIGAFHTGARLCICFLESSWSGKRSTPDQENRCSGALSGILCSSKSP